MKTKKNSTITTDSASGYMIDLCVISYSQIQNIRQEIQNLNAGWELVWGPAQLVSESGISYSLMYIVNDPTSGETAIVIRGTNPLSFEQWLQDFDLTPLTSFSQFVPGISSDIKITNGMNQGLSDLLSLTDPTTGQTAVSYLQNNPSSVYYVTGHSLGGALAPALMATLNHQLFGNTTSTNIALYPFAATTTGNAAFAAYIDSLYNGLPERVCNPLDVAPYCFCNLSAFQNIYAPNNITWGSVPELVRDIVDGLLVIGEVEGLSQYGTSSELPAVFNPSYPSFGAQAMYQHHATTYQALIHGF